MSLAVLAIGTAVPDAVIVQPDALRIARALIRPTTEQDTWLPSMYEGTGIRTRRSSLGAAVLRDAIDGTRYTESVFLPTGDPSDRGPTTAQRMDHYAELAPPLGREAALRALADSGVDPRSITHLVTVSCTGFVAPGIDRELIVGLGLAPTVLRTHVGYMGCHGAVNGLRVAGAFAGSDPRARVLLCAVELCTLHYHYQWNPGKIIANALFADGAAALVGVPVTQAPAGAWCVKATGSCLIPESADAMTWTIGDHGFEMTLARRVPSLIAKHLRPWLESWLSGQGLTVEGVRSWAVHPGGPRILQAVEEAVPLPSEALTASRAVFAEFGNMSSPTLLFILERLRCENAPRPCVALGFGPGLVAEAALLA
jgi:predicted naringenin-chalcone synthase